MDNSKITMALENFTIVLVTLVGIAYLYTFIWVIIEGKKRDLLSIGLIGVATLGTPFMAAAFVKATKSDLDRLIVKYLRHDNVGQKISFSKWLKLKLPTSSIIEVKDINDFCRFCNEEFQHNEHKCSHCGKPRIWFRITAYDTSSKRKDLFKIRDLPRISDRFKIKGISRQKHP